MAIEIYILRGASALLVLTDRAILRSLITWSEHLAGLHVLFFMSAMRPYIINT